jgi:hypothetical protein
VVVALLLDRLPVQGVLQKDTEAKVFIMESSSCLKMVLVSEIAGLFERDLAACLNAKAADLDFDKLGSAPP